MKTLILIALVMSAVACGRDESRDSPQVACKAAETTNKSTDGSVFDKNVDCANE